MPRLASQPVSKALARSFLALKLSSQALIVPMPDSIDLAAYASAGIGDEETWVGHHPQSDDEASDNATLLEKEAASGPRHKSRGMSWLRSPWFFLVDIVLVAMVMMLFATTPVNQHLDFLGDITGYVPSFSKQVVVFRSHPEFISNHTSLESLKNARQHWMDLLPRKCFLQTHLCP